MKQVKVFFLLNSYIFKFCCDILPKINVLTYNNKRKPAKYGRKRNIKRV